MSYKLEPHATYIYERVDGVTYARKLGDPPDTRFEIGRDASSTREQILKDQLWHDIRQAARHNPGLQDALDRVIVIYQLGRQHESVQHHPV
jgi:hypothetical protein